MGLLDALFCLIAVFFGGCDVDDWVEIPVPATPTPPPYITPPPDWGFPPFFQKDPDEFYSVGILDNSSYFAVDGTGYDVNQAIVLINGAPGTTSDLAPGQLVRVQGELDDGVRVASTVHYDATVIGRIEFVDENWVVVMGQRVIIDDLTMVDEPLAAGDMVEVSGLIGPNGEVLASRIVAAETDAEPYLIGKVADVDINTWTFEINGVEVDYSDAFVDLPFGTPRDGDLLIVDGLDLAGDRLVAERITAFDLNDLAFGGIDVEITGYIDNYRSAVEFEVAGHRVTSTLATLFTNGSQSDLGDGVKVTVQGSADEFDNIVARRVRHLGSGNPGRLDMTVADFSHLSVDGGWELTVVEGAESRITLYYGEDVTNVLDIDQQGDLLAIGFRKDVSLQIGPTRLTGEVTTSALRVLTLAGGTRVRMTGFSGDVLDVYLDGASKVVCSNCRYRIAHGELYGASRLTMENSVPHEEVVLHLSGASRATVSLETGARLSGSAAGNSAIRYYGDSIAENVATSSGGSVVRLGPSL